MDGYYWSVESCAWERCPSAPDALATPWSAHGLEAPALPRVTDASGVLRMPSRQQLDSGAVPPQRVAPAPVGVGV